VWAIGSTTLAPKLPACPAFLIGLNPPRRPRHARRLLSLPPDALAARAEAAFAAAGLDGLPPDARQRLLRRAPHLLLLQTATLQQKLPLLMEALELLHAWPKGGRGDRAGDDAGLAGAGLVADELEGGEGVGEGDEEEAEDEKATEEGGDRRRGAVARLDPVASAAAGAPQLLLISGDALLRRARSLRQLAAGFGPWRAQLAAMQGSARAARMLLMGAWRRPLCAVTLLHGLCSGPNEIGPWRRPPSDAMRLACVLSS
jgi:hypothetical protein